MNTLTKTLTDLYTIFAKYGIFFTVTRDSIDWITIDIDNNFCTDYDAFYNAIADYVNSVNTLTGKGINDYHNWRGAYIIDFSDLTIMID